ncbi:MAG: hypothetical protein BroJett040_01460 [Oligoflexia bacterium]|nr:MAG: hypothetical protein BroJett040_01460 [Oligoflexia bacterium]
MYALILLLSFFSLASELKSYSDKPVQTILSTKDFNKKIQAVQAMKKELDLAYRKKNNAKLLTLINYLDVVTEMKSPKDCAKTSADILYIDHNPKTEDNKKTEEAQIALSVLAAVCK